MDIRPFLDSKLHVSVWYKSKCKNCHTFIKEKIHDYGVLTFRELDKKMDSTNYPIEPFQCERCGTKNLPESLLYVDELGKKTITEIVIQYGHTIEGERAKKIEKGQKDRFKIFKDKENAFWDNYTDTALANWREFVNELVDFEIREAFAKLQIQSQASTLHQLRKEVFNRIKTIQEKQAFWRYANEYFVYNHLLDIGPLGWIIEQDIKYYGQNRMRFIILHFPLDESFEEMRTEWIGQVIKKSKGDNDFLFRRISMLTEELNRIRGKLTKYVHQIENLKVEKANLQNKLSTIYEELRKEQEKKIMVTRDPHDINKIKELKSFVQELIAELKEKERIIKDLQQQSQDIEINIPILEEGTEEDSQEKDTLNLLEGKTVAIIGGQRQEQATKETYPCTILTHTGRVLDPKFYMILKQADIIIILTQFVSHMAMWEAKAHALQEDKRIYYLKGLNIKKLLHEIT